jgi:hypothetical protein
MSTRAVGNKKKTENQQLGVLLNIQPQFSIRGAAFNQSSTYSQAYYLPGELGVSLEGTS